MEYDSITEKNNLIQEQFQRCSLSDQMSQYSNLNQGETYKKRKKLNWMRLNLSMDKYLLIPKIVLNPSSSCCIIV